MNIATALSYAVSAVNGSEGFRADAYLDRLAKPPVWTIGHGTTRIDGALVISGQTCSKAQADLWAMTDMTAAAHFVLHCVKAPLNDWQLAALISFCYNIGAGHFQRSSVVEALNLGLYATAADRLLEYDEAGGVPIPGLATRRGRERALFLIGLGTYSPPRLPPDIVRPPVIPPLEDTADVLNERELAALAAAPLTPET
jgi:GH24 family phage-related lysozyme (muramidase)